MAPREWGHPRTIPEWVIASATAESAYLWDDIAAASVEGPWTGGCDELLCAREAKRGIMESWVIPVALLRPSARPPGDRLVESIRAHGLEQPIRVQVRPGGGFRMGNGRHRIGVALALGWDTIPAHVSRADRDPGRRVNQ